VRLRQVALAAHDLGATTDALCAVLGLEIAFRDPGVAVFGLTNAVMPVGDTFLEVVSPATADAPARRYLERRGGDCGYMVMIQTKDFEADRSRAGRLGARVVWSGELPDIRGMHLHPKDTGGALLSLDEPVPAGEWRWAGPAWRTRVRTARVTALRGATIGCPRPEEVAARWGELLGLAPGKDARGPRIALSDGFLRFTLTARDPAAVLVAARERGLPTGRASFTLCGTEIELA
jgi:hypothetical protein